MQTLNLKTLEAQAKRTQRFYALKEQYKAVSIELTKYHLQDFKVKQQGLRTSAEAEEAKKLELNSKINAEESELEKFKLEHLTYEKQLADIQKDLNQWISGVSSNENDRNVLQEKIKFQDEKIREAHKLIEQNKPRIETLEFQLAELSGKIEQEKIQLSSVYADTENLKKLYDSAKEDLQAVKGNLDQKQKAYAEREKKIVDHEKKSAVNKATKDSLQRNLDQNKQESLFKLEELQSLEEQYKKLESGRAELESRLHDLLEEDKNTQEEIIRLEAELTTFQQDLNKENRAIDSKQNEYNLTKSLVENLEGFPEAVKFLRKNARWAKETPLLSDIIYCDEKYRICIENYLEPYLNYYVVESIDDAYMAVNLLSDSSKGRANFFVLESFKHFQIEEEIQIQDAISARSIVEYDSRYASLWAFLLKDVYLIDENSSSHDIRNLQETGKTFLTLSGKYAKTKHGFSGGAVGLFEGKKIGRAKNLEKLEKEIIAHTENARSLSLKMNGTQDSIQKKKLSFKKQEIEKTRSESSNLNGQCSAMKTRIETSKSFIDSAEVKLKEIAERIKSLEEEDKSTAILLDGLKAEQLKDKDDLERHDKVFVELNSKSTELSAQYNAQNLKYHQQMNKLSAYEQESKFKNDQLQELVTQQTKSEQVISENQGSVDELKGHLKQIEEKLLEGYGNRDQVKKDLESLENKFFTSKGNITAKENDLKEIQRQKANTEQLLVSIRDKQAELKVELSSVKERLLIEFNTDVNVVLNESISDEFTQAQLEEKVAEIKQKVDKFGEINPMALEAFEEMKKRYDFIVAQRDDLDTSRKTLANTISEIEQTAKHKFMDSFNNVRENFIRVFKTLFNEDDTADLVLVNPDDPLESKIDIIAKPKGKRPQIIDQLSGGEKTLTATALLFSLYLLKPAPFCIFDEVDAPLDDANISKFNNIIREFSKGSQFILVTHNKSTMTYMDVMYGVVMQEAGVSQVAPVDFRSWN